MGPGDVLEGLPWGQGGDRSAAASPGKTGASFCGGA